MLDMPALLTTQLSFSDVHAGVAAGELQRQAGELLASASAEKKQLQSALDKIKSQLENSKVAAVLSRARERDVYH
jgi:hypothetical protein